MVTIADALTSNANQYPGENSGSALQLILFRLYFYLWVPHGARNLRFQTSGGTGNADMYIRAVQWPTETAYDYLPYRPDNEETVNIPNPLGGNYYHVMLRARAPFSGVRLEASFDQ